MALLPSDWDKEAALPSPDEQFYDFIQTCGVSPSKVFSVVLDGNIHRFPVVGDKGREKSGWYVAYEDNMPAGVVGDWRSGQEFGWHADIGHDITEEERAECCRRVAEARRLSEEDRKKQQEVAAQTVSAILAPLSPVTEHPYLTKKRVGAYGLYETGDGRLIIPIYVGGRVMSAQYISPKGEKQFHCEGAVGGGYFAVGCLPPKPQSTLYVAEGYATSATIYETTGCTCVAALTAHNLVSVCQYLRDELGAEQEIVVVGDNDSSGVGQRKASEAAAAVGAQVVIPPIMGMDANDYLNSGGDLQGLLVPKRWLAAADDFSEKPAPIRWLIKKWIQAGGLAMVYGDSGTGKTFVVLDWVLRMASGIDTWAGLRVRPGGVVYLAGEGHYGLKARIAGWKKYHNVEHLNAWVSGGACDLNTPEGLAKTISEIRMIKTDNIAVIVVDTLHRFLIGDENKATDTKTMLDACAMLSNTFDSAVILVHHTGVNQDAKNRARGSSAWRGALDNQILISSSGDNIKLEQVKQKDSELADPIYLERIPVHLPGWYDDDGEAISTIVLEPDENGDKKEVSKLTKKQHLGIQAYRAAAAESGILNENNEFAGVLENDWREAFYKLYESENRDTKKKAFQRVRNELIDKKDIIITGETYMLATDYELECVQIARELIHNRDILGFCDKNAKSATGQTGQNN